MTYIILAALAIIIASLFRLPKCECGGRFEEYDEYRSVCNKCGDKM